MLRADVPETNAPNHAPWAEGDDDPFLVEVESDGDGEFSDHLAIDIDSFWAVLDEESGSHGHSLSSPKVFSQGNLGAGKASQLQDGIPESMAALPLGDGGPEPSQLTLSDNLDSSDSKKVIGLDYACDTPGSFSNCNMHNQATYNGSLSNSVLTGDRVSGSQPTNLTNDWLSLSSSEYNAGFGDPVGGPIDSLIDFNYQQLQTEVAKCSPPSEFCDSQHAEYASSIHSDSREGQEPGQMGGDSSLQMEVESLKDSNFASFTNKLLQHNGEMAGSFELMSTEKYGLGGGMHNNTCTNDRMDTKTWAGNMFPPMYPDFDPDANDGPFAQNVSRQFFPGRYSQIFGSSDKQHSIHAKDEREDKLHAPQSICTISKVEHDTQGAHGSFASEISIIDFYSSLAETSCTEANNHQGMNFKCESNMDSVKVPFSEISASYGNCKAVTHSAKPSLPKFKPPIQSKKPSVYFKNEQEDQLLVPSYKQCHSIGGTINQTFQKNQSGGCIDVDDDADICILDDISAPSCPPRPVVPIKTHIAPPRVGSGDPCHSGAGSSRFQADDERLTYRIALQDLAQPKLEASPPEGVLSVPLLRHQRIALSWMVQKETHSLHCSGGILADDQGLGKTVSTIALILKERSPQSKASAPTVKSEPEEALNLDEDDEVAELDGMKQLGNSELLTMNRPAKNENTSVAVKGRPAAGTLIVCPTSVLRQWAEELKNKVTSKANLSFLVYHGTNRTKDPNELAKYDVVLTTYSIVSLEVPKQALVDKEDEEKEKPYATGPSTVSSTSKKRKNPPSSNSKRLKDKTGDRVLLESAARPLARVGWFRVVLDEAQTIKNYRTQVARACWGLRAKRRWCLSGTPIQNAVDDLYSYFRFLRYDPYAVYNLFCSTIKTPISRHPATGYKKLQAVLRTIMLRRTKGTLIDGQPIINLPPRLVTMKSVGFSSEERAFYSQLEAESRETFKGYADAGTVKQNYVNILLMLLRLRQACDHPLLVKGYDSNSIWRSSLEASKKIPREKQIELLNCLEGCMAICTICNDPPEDAVVSICGHVFCNQCISEHLTGDDNHCLSAHCKVQLSGASVFSKATLKNSISGLPGHDCSEPVETTKPLEDVLSSDSSKIKAAIEILQSLPKSDDFDNGDNTGDEGTEFPENTDNPASVGRLNDENGRGCSNSGKCLKVWASEKAIVFSQWTRMLDLLEARLKSSCIQYRRLDGTMSVVARDKAVKDFNTLPEVTVMIMSLKAASLGLNLVSACHVLLLDLWWNPTTEDQAIDRAHRIGQTRPVTVSRLMVENTVEDRILALQEKKREMVASAFGEDESGTRQTRLTVEDLKYLFMV